MTELPPDIPPWSPLADRGRSLGGIATGVGHFGSSYSASSAGRKWVLGGVGAAMLAGLAHTIAMTVYNAT